MKGMTVVAAVVLLACIQSASAEEQGVSVNEVIIGMSNALTGPASALGTGVKNGALAYFNKVNSGGGINGRKIKIISYDDGYEPKQTVETTNKLITRDKVFALFGYVGTPTSTAIVPIINKEKVPYFAPFTGAEFLRKPVNRYIFNVRGSYFDEAEMQVEYLTKKLGKKRIGVFIQNDAYGLAVKGGVIKALKARSMALAGEGTYERNTTNVEAGLAALKTADPDAVVMVGTYKAMAAFIKKAKAQGFTPVFLNVSFVGTAALVKELGGSGDGVIISQVMPSPTDASLPLVRQYQADMRAAGYSDLDYTDLEGYVDAVVFTEVLKKAGKNLTRGSFIAAAESLNVTDGGLTFVFSPSNHQAMSQIYLTKISGNKIVMVQ
ncbi:MAG: leucine-, isoleucine-, valine-, threonine-, and alanine-binding protein [Nitrospirae bacterium GWC2_56_14]|nr:MAG: leucine-, isoleucine-, valine-, threonine-, and alanine-binding protein [Nitrospirae bacterium GWC2_56_14]